MGGAGFIARMCPSGAPIDLGCVWQEQLGTGLSNNLYTLSYSANGQAVAVRNGSASVVSNAAGRSLPRSSQPI